MYDSKSLTNESTDPVLKLPLILNDMSLQVLLDLLLPEILALYDERRLMPSALKDKPLLLSIITGAVRTVSSIEKATL